jgi:hypothetical protein
MVSRWLTQLLNCWRRRDPDLKILCVLEVPWDQTAGASNDKRNNRNCWIRFHRGKLDRETPSTSPGRSARALYRRPRCRASSQERHGTARASDPFQRTAATHCAPWLEGSRRQLLCLRHLLRGAATEIDLPRSGERAEDRVRGVRRPVDRSRRSRRSAMHHVHCGRCNAVRGTHADLIYTISPAAVRTSSNSGIWLVRIAGKKPEFQLVEAADRGFFPSPRTEARPL